MVDDTKECITKVQAACGEASWMLKTMNSRPVGDVVVAESHSVAAVAVAAVAAAANTEAGDAVAVAGMDPIPREPRDPSETKKKRHFSQKPKKKA